MIHDFVPSLAYPKRMFFDSQGWPPSPGGSDPPPAPPPRINATQERMMMRLVGALLLVMFLGPFAGSSVVSAVVELARSIIAFG